MILIDMQQNLTQRPGGRGGRFTNVLVGGPAGNEKMDPMGSEVL